MSAFSHPWPLVRRSMWLFPANTLMYTLNLQIHSLMSFVFFFWGRLTLSVLQSHFGDKPYEIRVVCPVNGTAVLKGWSKGLKYETHLYRDGFDHILVSGFYSNFFDCSRHTWCECVFHSSTWRSCVYLLCRSGWIPSPNGQEQISTEAIDWWKNMYLSDGWVVNVIK